MVNIKRMTTKKLGELLVEEKLLSEEQVQDSLREQANTGELLGEVLVKLGYLTEFDIAKCISLQFSLPFLLVSCYQIQPAVINLIPLETQRQQQFILLDKIGNVVTIAIAGLLSEDVFGEIAKATECEVQVFVSTTSDVLSVLDEFAERQED